MNASREQPFKAEVSEVLGLVVNSLYSHKEIFLRELISNAADAVDRLRFRAISEPNLQTDDAPLCIRIIPDKKAKTLTIWDNGAGMTEQELETNLGTIAHSGTREFAEKLKQASQANQAGIQFIGQFGVGFYSAYLVADRVEVTSRAAGTNETFVWSSDAKQTFTIAPGERDRQGTSVVLHLKDDCLEYVERYRLKELVTRYSDYISHPIELPKQLTDDEEKSGVTPTFERVNQASALWQRSPKDVTPEQYQEFYKHLAHDWEASVAHRHFHVEGVQMFAGLLFLPKRAAFDLYDASAKHGVRLHVKRVFVMENCEELLPRYLRFVRGVVDSEDLPLNVSREILQDSRIIRTMRKQVVNHSIGMLEELAEREPATYVDFWKDFGAALKEGLHFSSDDRERLSKLVRYESSAQAGLTSLADYVGRMKEQQKAIYYALGPSRELVQASPHLEGLKKRGFEVLFMTDPIDSFAVESLQEFDGKPLVSAMTEKLDLGEDTEPKEKPSDESQAQTKSLVERMTSVLGEHVREVRLSDRLTESPVCLTMPEGGLPPYMERILRAKSMQLPESKRVLEVNADHPVISALGALHERDPGSVEVGEWIELLYDQALVAEGSPVDDPAVFAQRLTKLLGRVTTSAAAAG